ncbi:MAG TPA: hypothetical protein VFO60_04890 [Candidatus Dormibacteraeota bacterium]|nr:hypothetical protein [Candidatus Dormibacteraeota bacterium]
MPSGGGPLVHRRRGGLDLRDVPAEGAQRVLDAGIQAAEEATAVVEDPAGGVDEHVPDERSALVPREHRHRRAGVVAHVEPRQQRARPRQQRKEDRRRRRQSGELRILGPDRLGVHPDLQLDRPRHAGDVLDCGDVRPADEPALAADVEQEQEPPAQQLDVVGIGSRRHGTPSIADPGPRPRAARAYPPAVWP